ncbi:MAG: TonB-dependent receptor [Acidobacteriia bacterium]|nr:TonB-dependent receptor [Terriglobia bacterium]
MKSLLVCFALSLVLTVGLRAQADRASITGTVTDSTGAVAPGVEVTAVNVETRFQTGTVTNDAGIYQILNLPIGKYALSFAKQGFRKVDRDGITLQIAQVAKVDAALQVGAIAEVVNVTEAAPLLDPAATQVGAGLNSNVVTDLPLDIRGGRSLENFAYATVPGVEGDNWQSHIAGSMAFTKEVLIDGTSAVVQIGGHIGESSPSMESIQEFKVETSGVRAEDGRTGGGVYKFTIKSGTNQLHGSAFGIFRSETLNANSWTNNFYGRPRDPDRSKTYGASAGGPIRKNKTFVFGAFEKYTQEDFRLGAYDLSAPIAPFLDGNFAALLNKANVLGSDALGRPVYSGEIFDPATQRAVKQGAVDTATGLTAARDGTVKDGFGFDRMTGLPGAAANMIPSNRFSSASKKITDIFRKQYAPMRDGLINNSASTLANTTWFHQTQITIKADHNLSDKHHLSGHFVWTERPRMLVDQNSLWDPNDTADGGGPLANNRLQNVTSRRVAVNDSYGITPTMLNVASFTYGRYRNPSQPYGDTGTNWPQTLGVGAGYNNFPTIAFGNAVNGISTTKIGNQWAGFYVGNSFIWNDALSWVRGKHTFKFGGEFRALQLNSHGGIPRLDFKFASDQTGLPQENFAANKSGFGFASFLLGAANQGSRGVPTDYYGRRKTLSLFVQDDWKIAPRLTATLDLRWEVTMPYHELYGRWSTFSTTTQSKSFGIPGTVVFLNSGGQTFEKERDWKEFSPHVGLAYQLKPKVVIRAAYGIFFSPIGMNYWEGVPYNWAPGYYGLDQVSPRGDKAPVFYWDGGYPGNYIAPKQDPDFVPWGPVSVDPKSLFAGYTHNWDFGVQFEALRDTKLEVNYLGNIGRRLHGGNLKGNNPDMTAYSNWIKNHGMWNGVWDAASAAKEGVPYPFPGYNSYAFGALTPYPQIWQNWNWPDNMYFVGEQLGKSSYKALQIAAERRGASGLTVNASYTLSAARSNVQTEYGGFDETWETTGQIQNLSPEWLAKEAGAPIYYDRTHILKGVVAYDLPFGKGRRFASGGSKALDAIAGGWTLSGAFRYDTGQPLSVNSNNYYPGWYGAIYAARKETGDYSRKFTGSTFDFANPKNQSNTYFDTGNFSNPAFGDFYQGVKYRPDFRGFGFSDEQIALLKNIRIAERFRAQFRAEFYNIFNRHHFDDPDTNIASPTFGKVINLTGDARQGQLGLRFEW